MASYINQSFTYISNHMIFTLQCCSASLRRYDRLPFGEGKSMDKAGGTHQFCDVSPNNNNSLARSLQMSHFQTNSS